MATIVDALNAGFTAMVTDITNGIAAAAPIIVPVLGITVGVFVIVRFVKKFLGR